MQAIPSILSSVLDAHAQWLARKGGRRANFTGVTLNDCNFVDAHLERAVFSGATLLDADLSGAELWKAKRLAGRSTLG